MIPANPGWAEALGLPLPELEKVLL
jgi:hypothetical protein